MKNLYFSAKTEDLNKIPVETDETVYALGFMGRDIIYGIVDVLKQV